MKKECKNCLYYGHCTARSRGVAYNCWKKYVKSKRKEKDNEKKNVKEKTL